MTIPGLRVSLSRYTRGASTERELAALAQLSLPQLLARALSPSINDRPSEEALVRIIRLFLSNGNPEAAGKVLEELTRRVSRFVGVYAGSVSRANENDSSDMREDILSEMYAGVCDLTPAGEFWECMFWSCLKKKSVTVARKCRLRVQTVSTVVTDEGDEVDIVDTIPDDCPSVESLVELDEALDRLPRQPKPIHLAYWLRHHVGLQIASKDPAEVTIASHLKVSRATVENYLAEAEAILESHRQETTLDAE